MLNEEQLEALTKKYGKIGVRDYDGHQIVFRRPTRDMCREYRRMRESDAEKHEAMESLAQKMLVAFDGEEDINKARTVYTCVFLEESPLFVNNPQTMAVLSSLTGIVEEEDARDLGKGASVRSARRVSTPTA